MKIITIAAGLAFVSSAALGSVPVGLGELSASVDATATYDSNVFGNHDAIADYSGTLTPRLSYQRKAGQLEAEASAGIAFIRYVDQTELNANNVDAHVTIRTSQTDLRNYTGSLSASYRETSDVNADINTRIETKTTAFDGHGTFTTGPRTDLVLTGHYDDSLHSIGSDQDFFTSSALWDYKDFFYGHSLNLSGEYDRLTTSGDNALGVPLDQTSYTFSVGLSRTFNDNAFRAGITYGYRVLDRSQAETQAGQSRKGGSVITLTLNGPFLPAQYFPKIKSSFSLSYQDAATPGINDTGTKELTGSLNLTWEARENTQVSFTAQRSQRLSVDDLTVVTSDVQLGISQVLRYNLTGSLTAEYDWSTFTGEARRDRTASAIAGLQYHFAKAWDANFSYRVNSTTSTLRQATFDRSVVSLGVTYRF